MRHTNLLGPSTIADSYKRRRDTKSRPDDRPDLFWFWEQVLHTSDGRMRFRPRCIVSGEKGVQHHLTPHHSPGSRLVDHQPADDDGAPCGKGKKRHVLVGTLYFLVPYYPTTARPASISYLVAGGGGGSNNFFLMFVGCRLSVSFSFWRSVLLRKKTAVHCSRRSACVCAMAACY